MRLEVIGSIHPSHRQVSDAMQTLQLLERSNLHGTVWTMNKLRVEMTLHFSSTRSLLVQSHPCYRLQSTILATLTRWTCQLDKHGKSSYASRIDQGMDPLSPLCRTW